MENLALHVQYEGEIIDRIEEGMKVFRTVGEFMGLCGNALFLLAVEVGIRIQCPAQCAGQAADFVAGVVVWQLARLARDECVAGVGDRGQA